ncbi:GNAT family N-acetyltransferase [Paludibacterium paludis]|uniref:RimJ/RimL family protein N-acetyltransferase n=1 Tax=Paludibacterium paludis TaxID=1225769 RepID=A0A918U8T0_9NEIS|nr:GNAT family N-acetyltransferase [Paludibacterium paludis]GGY10739.1 hypothetical protein GCM10011289_11890 [Paludibacterium paludis]
MRTLHTPRLILEPQTRQHAKEMFHVLSDPAIYRYENTPPPSIGWLQERFERLEERRNPHNDEYRLNWVVRHPEQGLIGFVQASVYEDRHAEIAYVFASHVWGNGYAGEAVTEMIAELAGTYGAHHFLAVLKCANESSLRLLKRSGFETGTGGIPPRMSVDPDETVFHRTLGATRSAGTRLAIAQMPMAPTAHANLATITRYLALAAEHGAKICVFPELSVPGFHRGIREEAKSRAQAEALDRIRAHCRSLRIAALFGTLVPPESHAPFNVHVHIDASGNLAATVAKNGLTPSEQTFLTTGHTRAIGHLGHLRTTSVLCREVLDLALLARQLPPGSVDMIFWPSIISAIPDGADGIDYLPNARQLARTASAWLVQCNWPMSLNEPGARQLGGSVVIAPNGEVTHRLPVNGLGMGLVTLGETGMMWLAQDQ